MVPSTSSDIIFGLQFFYNYQIILDLEQEKLGIVLTKTNKVKPFIEIKVKGFPVWITIILSLLAIVLGSLLIFFVVRKVKQRRANRTAGGFSITGNYKIKFWKRS